MSDSPPSPDPPIRRAPLGELKVYQVYEHELDQLARGSPAAISLNFALSLLPISVTLAVTLWTVQFDSDRAFVSFLSVCVITLIAGLLCLAHWWKSHTSAKVVVERIKRQMDQPLSVRSPRSTLLTDTTKHTETDS